MRRFLALALVTAACATAPPPPPPAPPVHGFTIEEEARVLAFEDRREYDPAWVAEWAAHPNSLHRQRLATALGRIGPHSFIDTDGDLVRDEGEEQAGVSTLIALTDDPDAPVRTAAAFALGEIGDRSAVDALFKLASGSDVSVAAEAIEAL